MIAPFFFEGSVTGETCLAMLRNFFLSMIRNFVDLYLTIKFFSNTILVVMFTCVLGRQSLLPKARF